MVTSANTLGRFIFDLMQKQNYNNSSLAAVAGVSESVIRNILKHGMDSHAKDPDPRTLRRVADALGIDAIMLFRLAGYIPPAANANSIRADFLADVFDELPPEKQDAVMGVLEAMTDKQVYRGHIQTIRQDVNNPLSGFDLSAPGLIRLMANDLIVKYAITEPADIDKIEPDAQLLQHKWKDLPQSTQQRVKALIRHKLSLDYDPTMVDPEWRA